MPSLLSLQNRVELFVFAYTYHSPPINLKTKVMQNFPFQSMPNFDFAEDLETVHYFEKRCTDFFAVNFIIVEQDVQVGIVLHRPGKEHGQIMTVL